MGPSQSAQLHNTPTLQDIFPSITQYKPYKAKNNTHPYQQAMYKHQTTGKTAIVRTFDISGNNKNSVQNYYLARSKIKSNPHVLQMFDMKLLLNKSNNKIGQSVSNSSLCSVPSLKYQNSQSYSFWILLQSSTITLQDQILNRVNKKSFEEIQLWSVLSSCVLGSLNLLEQGCKQPVLSPKGIGLTQDGVVKVGQWQFVSKINQKYVAEDGQVIFGKFGESVSEVNRNSLNQLLFNYYWAPEGLKAMQSFMALGRKQNKLTTISHRITSQRNYQKFQIFSLGMTLISMCLRNCYYRTDTFSQKYLNKLTHQAVQIRKIEGKQLSHEIKHLIESMVKWDPSERMSYIQLRDEVLQYFNDHPQEMKYSSVSMKTFENMSINDTINIHYNKSRNNSQSSNLSMNLTQESFMNSITFQKGFKFNRKKNYVQSQQIISVKSLNDSYQGSGMVEQGTGDDDQHLQIQKQEQKETNDAKSHCQQLSNNPITHRTQKQIQEQVCEIKKDNSPYLRLGDINQNICPNSTPNVQYSPNIHTNFNGGQKEQNIGHQINQNYKNMNNQLYKPQSFKISLNHLKIQTNFNQNMSFRPQLQSNRGSYRSSSKEPPKLNSARNCNQNKVTQFGYQIPKPLLSNQNMNKQQNSYKIEYTIKNKYEPSQKLVPDDEDKAEFSINYSNIFRDPQIQEEQIENPDIFQTFEELQSIYQSDCNSNKQIQVSNHLNPLTKLKQIPQTKSIITKDHTQQKNIYTLDSNDNRQFATFNQKNKGIQDSFARIKIETVPSKWKKSQNIRKSREVYNKDESLFTDPKLLEYIKSPVKPPNYYQIDNTSKFNTRQFMDIINQQKIVQSISFPSLVQNKQNFNIDNTQQNDQKIFKNYLERNSSKENLIKNKFQNEIQFIDHYSENTKIVKEKVSRGFYEGEKKNGLRSGYGVFYYNQGGKYKGNWFNNQMHGKGTLQYADGRIAYQGDWNCDQLHGKGVLYNQSPNFVTEGLNYKDFDELDQTWIFYEGNFEHDDKSGIGLLVLSNQEQFIGQFKNDMAEGLGQYLRVNGTTIKGIWHKNKLVKVYQE